MDSQLVQKSSTSDLGITCMILYFSIFVYIYISAFYKKKGTMGSSVINYKNGLDIASAVYNSEKVGVSVFVAMFICVWLYILYLQDFTSHYLGITLIVVSVLIGFLVYSFVYTKNNNTFARTLFTFSLIASCQVIGLSVLYLYDKAYPGDDISEVRSTVYTLNVFFVVISALIAYTGIINKQTKKIPNRLARDFVSFFGAGYVLFFGILIYYLSLYPPLDL